MLGPWPKEIKDKKILSQIYFIAYSKIAEIQLELTKFIDSTKIYEPDKLVIEGRSVSSVDFSPIVDIYGMSGMESEINGVVDFIRALNEDIKALNPL